MLRTSSLPTEFDLIVFVYCMFTISFILLDHTKSTNFSKFHKIKPN